MKTKGCCRAYCFLWGVFPQHLALGGGRDRTLRFTLGRVDTPAERSHAARVRQFALRILTLTGWLVTLAGAFNRLLAPGTTTVDILECTTPERDLGMYWQARG